jgi:hypothetical protein
VVLVYCIVFFFVVFIEDFIPNTRLAKRIYYQTFTLLEYSFFTGILWINIRTKQIRKSIIGLSIAFISFLIIYFFTAKFKRIDSIPIGIETILVFTYIFYFFLEQFKETTNQSLSNISCFWFAVGILIYLGGTFFINILANNMERDQIDKYWFLTYIADIIRNILFAIGIIILSRRPIEKSKTENQIPYLDIS